jgi:hypothetical protein
MLHTNNTVLRRIFERKSEKVVGGWRRLHNEELRNLYAPLNVVRVITSRMMSWAGHVAHTGEMRNSYNILAGKPKRKRPVGRPKCRWEDNIRMDITETGCEGVDWMHLAQDRNQWQVLVNTVINIEIH